MKGSETLFPVAEEKEDAAANSNGQIARESRMALARNLVQYAARLCRNAHSR